MFAREPSVFGWRKPSEKSAPKIRSVSMFGITKNSSLGTLGSLASRDTTRSRGTDAMRSIKKTV